MKKRSKKLGLVLWVFFQMFVIIYVLLVTGFILCKNNFGYTQISKFVFLTINQNNYEYIDDSELGELIVIREDNEVKNGDVIYYYSVVDEQYVVKSGFVKNIITSDKEDIFVLDDQNNITVSSNRLIGTTMSSYSNLGDILDVLTSSVGFLVFVLLPIILIFAYKIYELIIIVSNERKVLDVNDDELDRAKSVKRVVSNNSEKVVKSDDDVEII